MTDREKAAFLNGILFGAAHIGNDYCAEHLFKNAAKALQFAEDMLDTVFDEVTDETEVLLAAGFDFVPRTRVLGSNGTENTSKDSGGVLCRLGRVAEFRRPHAGTHQDATRPEVGESAALDALES